MGPLIGRYVTVFYRTAFASAKNNIVVGVVACLFVNPFWGGGRCVEDK